MSNYKVLCFTNSYHRPYHLYNTINCILNNQTYKSFDYAVGISIDNTKDESLYSKLLEDFSDDPRLHIFFHPNLDQHDNYLYPIRNMTYDKYEVFIKIDDDDIYKKNYLKYNLSIYKKQNCDIISSIINYQINNNTIYQGVFDNVGGYWHEDLESDTQFGMPFSYVFNKKCLEILLNTTAKELKTIHPFEDPGWRRKWRNIGVKSHVITNADNSIYHIHGKNISSSPWLIPDHTYYTYDNDLFTICLFKHAYWESYIIINKKYQTIYNILNNDNGTYTIDGDYLIIKWDKYPTIEKFIKKNLVNNTFIYELIL